MRQVGCARAILATVAFLEASFVVRVSKVRTVTWVVVKIMVFFGSLSEYGT